MASRDRARVPRDTPEVQGCVKAWPENARNQFAAIRAIVFDAASRADVGPLIETLKWGQPAWLPERKRVGSTLRCCWSPARPAVISLYVHCGTTLIETMKTLYPAPFEYEGNRALHMALDAPLPCDAIDHCALLTLTYHRKAT
ncbi:MAG: DUF1801 domain-containing protein [Pseudomonadota bacterium]